MKYILLVLTIVFFSGCYTTKHQHALKYDENSISYYPHNPDYHRDYTKPRFEKGHDGIYLDLVKKYSDRYYISESLILSIMETESNFNKYAKSNIPAIGLMQIVPGSAGKDILGWRPTHSYLYNPNNNIKVGTKYLNKIYYKYLKGIKNPKSKEYLTIAAYNTGVGNVLRSFSRNKSAAFRKINSKSSQDIYSYLLRKLPYKETREYLLKVTQRKNKYTGYDG